MKLPAIILFLICIVLPDSAGALVYENLKPGLSTKSEADRHLGAPLKTLRPDRLYSYPVDQKDLKALLVAYDDAGLIESIQLKFLHAYPELQIRQWFELGKPDRYEYDALGNKIAVHRTEGVRLYYEGMDETAKVVGMSHIKTGLPEKSFPETPSADLKTASISNQPGKKTEKQQMQNYLGILLSFKPDYPVAVNTFPGSPAGRAGIKMGDSLMEFNTRSLKQIGSKAFISMVRQIPSGEPISLKIKRGRQFRTFRFVMAAQTEEQFRSRRSKNKKAADTFFQKAQTLKKNRHYAKAANTYAQAMALDPENTLNYDYQAWCLDKAGRRKEGYSLLEMSLLLADKMYNNYLYGKFLNFDRQYQKAVPYLEKAARLVKKDGSYYFPYRELGGAKFMLDDYRSAITALDQSVAMGDKTALTVGTLGCCHDKIGNRTKAIHYYEKYLSMKSSDAKMNRMAKTRLAKLKGHSKNTGKNFFDAVNMILKEVQNDN